MLEKLAKQTAVYGISTIAVRFLSYLLTPVFTRVFGPEAYGIVTDVYALIPFALVVLTMGLESAYFRFAAKADAAAAAAGGTEGEIAAQARAGKRRLFATAWGVTLLAASLFFLLTAFGRERVAEWMGEAYVAHPEYVLLVAAVVWFDVAACLPFSRLREQGRAMTFVGIKALGVVVNVALAIGFALAGLYGTPFGVGWVFVANLIASAVKESGLGERIAYAFMLKFVRDAKSLIISIFALTFVLSLLIPHPFPRAFLILAVVSVIAESAGYGDDDRGKLGFLVFAAAAPGSMFFLTGDSTLNPLVAQYSAEAGGMSPSFVDWFLYMSVPMLVALLCTLFLGLFLFKPSKELVYDREQIVAKQAALGKLSVKEIRTIVWLVIAIALWLTVSGDYIGWVTLAIGVALAMPIIGEVLTPASWNAVDIKSLMFLTAAMAVGSVGGATGMNAWIADVVLPSSVPENIFLFALLVAALSMIIHMFMARSWPCSACACRRSSALRPAPA